MPEESESKESGGKKVDLKEVVKKLIEKGVEGFNEAKKAATEVDEVSASLMAMQGSALKVQAEIKGLQNFAATTPFDFKGAAEAATQLARMGIAADQIIPTMKAAGNAVAASTGETKNFSGVVEALGKIKEEGKFSAESLKELEKLGVPAAEILQGKLGLTREQLEKLAEEGIEAGKALPALTAGMGEMGGGNALAALSDTLPAKMENLHDAVERAHAAVGQLFNEKAASVVGVVGTLTDKLAQLAEAHPVAAGLIGMAPQAIESFQKAREEVSKYGKAFETVKNLVKGGEEGKAAEGVSKFAKAFGVVKGLLKGAEEGKAAEGVSKYAKVFGVVKDLVLGAADAKEGLTEATEGDSAAEAAKALVAGKEGDAIEEVGKKALETAASKGELAEETGEAAQKSGLLAKIVGFAKQPLMKQGVSAAEEAGENAATTFVGNEAKLSAWSNGLTSGAPASNWSLSNMAGAQGFMGTSGYTALTGPTVGSMALGAGLGLGAAAGQREDLKALGVSEGTADTAATATGLATAALVAFNPPAAALIGAAELLRLGVNKFYNEPAEARAEKGSGVDADPDLQAKLVAATSPKEKADVYRQLKEKLQGEGDTSGAANAEFEENRFNKLEKKRTTPGTAEYAADQNALEQKNAAERNAELDRRPKMYPGQGDPYQIRNGAQPPGPTEYEKILAGYQSRANLPEQGGGADGSRARGNIQRVGNRVRIKFDDLEIADPSVAQHNDSVSSAYG